MQPFTKASALRAEVLNPCGMSCFQRCVERLFGAFGCIHYIRIGEREHSSSSEQYQERDIGYLRRQRWRRGISALVDLCPTSPCGVRQPADLPARSQRLAQWPERYGNPVGPLLHLPPPDCVAPERYVGCVLLFLVIPRELHNQSRAPRRDPLPGGCWAPLPLSRHSGLARLALRPHPSAGSGDIPAVANRPVRHAQADCSFHLSNMALRVRHWRGGVSDAPCRTTKRGRLTDRPAD